MSTIIENVVELLIDPDTYAGTNIRSVDLRYVDWLHDSMLNAFKNCPNLVSVSHIINAISNMQGSFENCPNFTTLDSFPVNVSNIIGTFKGCTSLLSIPQIPEGIEDFTDTFNGCSALVTTPDIVADAINLTRTFYGCSSLINVKTIPNGVTNLTSTFNGCSSLVKIPNIPVNVTLMDNTFANCTSLSGRAFIYSDKVTSAINCFNNSGNANKYVYLPFYKDGEQSTTYVSFLNAGYDSLGTKDHVYLRDINATSYTLTINPTPADATVVLTAAGFEQEGNAIVVDEGTEVTWEVSKNYYISQNGVITVNSNTVLPIELSAITDPNYEFVINNDKADLTKYIGTATDITVPDYVGTI